MEDGGAHHHHHEPNGSCQRQPRLDTRDSWRDQPKHPQQFSNPNKAHECCGKIIRPGHLPLLDLLSLGQVLGRKWFRSFSILPGDQSARIQENHTLWRPQPQSFASGSDPTLILLSTGKNKGGRVHSSLSPWTWTVPPALTGCG